MHFLGQTTVLTLASDRGTGETYCMPHHLTIDGGKRQLMIAALRYYDTFVKVDGAWLFAERLLYVDWIEERVLSGQRLNTRIRARRWRFPLSAKSVSSLWARLEWSGDAPFALRSTT